MADAPLSTLLVDVLPALADALRLGTERAERNGSAPAMTLTAVAACDLQSAASHDAVLLQAADAAALRGWSHDSRLLRLAAEAAVVVVTPVVDDALDTDLLLSGVQSVVQPDADLPRVLIQAIRRRAVDRAARLAYATDLATGLPHEAQLLEHLTQLLALREREPGPMSLIVLRIRGAEVATAKLGPEAANVLRRKIAVRLRSGLRSGDVVASIGPDTFGVLLGHLEAASHGDAVARKLLRSLQDPLMVEGRPCRVRADLGLAHHPAHGKDAAALLLRATTQALSLGTAPGDGRGVATLSARTTHQAANDSGSTT